MEEHWTEVGYLVTEVDCLWRGFMAGPAQLDHLVEVGKLVVELVAGSLLHGPQEVLLDVLDEGMDAGSELHAPQEVLLDEELEVLDAGSELHAPQDVMLEVFEELGEVVEAGSEVHGPHGSVLVVVDVEGSALHGPHGPTALHAPSFSPLLELEELEAGSELHGTQDVMLEELDQVVEAGSELHGPQDVMLESWARFSQLDPSSPRPMIPCWWLLMLTGLRSMGPMGPQRSTLHHFQHCSNWKRSSKHPMQPAVADQPMNRHSGQWCTTQGQQCRQPQRASRGRQLGLDTRIRTEQE